MIRMTNFRILVDGVDTGYTLTGDTAAHVAEDAYTYWWDCLGKFSKAGEPNAKGIITAVGPVRFPDGYQDVASF